MRILPAPSTSGSDHREPKDSSPSFLALRPARPPLFPFSPYIFTSLLPYLFLDRHRDEKPVTATPLESALTNRDARNPFRILSYENCRVSVRSRLAHPICIALDNFAQRLSFLNITKCPSRNSFALTFIQNAGRVPPSQPEILKDYFKFPAVGRSPAGRPATSAILNAEMAALAPSMRRSYSKSERIRPS